MYSKLAIDILSNHGRVENNCLLEKLNRNTNFEKEISAPLIEKSTYFNCDQFFHSLENFQNGFSTFCVNIQGLKNKFTELETFVEKIHNKIDLFIRVLIRIFKF